MIGIADLYKTVGVVEPAVLFREVIQRAERLPVQVDAVDGIRLAEGHRHFRLDGKIHALSHKAPDVKIGIKVRIVRIQTHIRLIHQLIADGEQQLLHALCQIHGENKIGMRNGNFHVICLRSPQSM